MRDIHTIRLRGPWQVHAAEGAEPVTVKMPACWSDILGHKSREYMASEQVRLTRHFNTPTGLEDLEEVWLVVELSGACVEVRLNDQPLVWVDELPLRVDITSLLKERNKLEILIAIGNNRAQDGPVGEVRLEIGFP